MFRLLTYNIQRGGHGRLDAIAEVIDSCAPDLVLLQEATDRSNVERLAAATGMADWRTSGTQSLGFLSRRPVAHCEWVRPRISRHAFVEVVPEGDAVRVFGVHLSAVHAAWTEQRRVLELRALLRSIERHQHGFHVLAGDFNTVAPGEAFDIGRLPMRIRPLVWLSGGRINWRTIELVLRAGYVDAFRLHHPGEPGATLPASNPYVRLDYVFAPQQHAGRVLDCRVVRGLAAEAASDHLPVVADLALDGPDVPISEPGPRTPR
jgi:endonuclease/exonuclease/phosphatase family metal-dependent hydrolase